MKIYTVWLIFQRMTAYVKLIWNKFLLLFPFNCPNEPLSACVPGFTGGQPDPTSHSARGEELWYISPWSWLCHIPLWCNSVIFQSYSGMWLLWQFSCKIFSLPCIVETNLALCLSEMTFFFFFLPVSENRSKLASSVYTQHILFFYPFICTGMLYFHLFNVARVGVVMLWGGGQWCWCV